MTTYFINRAGKLPLKIVYEGVPPCLWCGDPVSQPSMDGPLVCALCDCGLVSDAEGVRKWTASEYQQRSARARSVIAGLEAAAAD
jgi:hypothetical protein